MKGIVENSESAKKNSEYYNKFWNKYKLNNEDKVRALFIKRKLKKYSSKYCEILDLGCGYGWMSSFLKDFGNYNGVDFSENAISFANKEFKNNGNFFLADTNSETLGFPKNKKFDIIVCSEVIEHVIDHQSFVNQLYSFLKKGGLLILTTPNGDIWKEFLKMHSRESMQPVENWLTPKALINLFVQNDFMPIENHGRIIFPALKNQYTARFSRIIDRIVHFFFIEDLFMRFFKKNSLYQMLVLKKNDKT